MEDQIPDYENLCRFRNEIVVKNTYKLLLKKINKVLEKHQEIVKTGVIIDPHIRRRNSHNLYSSLVLLYTIHNYRYN
ncbi:MAG: hypothetical protein ACMUEL_09750 [Flavobacteriales bacterium Tduv]